MGVRREVSNGVEDGHRLPTLRKAVSGVARPQGIERLARRAVVILQGVHRHPLPYAHVSNSMKKLQYTFSLDFCLSIRDELQLLVKLVQRLSTPKHRPSTPGIDPRHRPKPQILNSLSKKFKTWTTERSLKSQKEKR
jgi:hypothetical protein